MKVNRLMSAVQAMELALKELKQNQVTIQRTMRPEPTILTQRLEREISGMKNDIGEMEV